MSKIDLSIIIVSWNVSGLLQRCLYSIYQNQGNLALEILLVDNASADNTIKMIQDSFPEVKIIANRRNRGFARANNQAISLARGDYVLLLNPDTEIIGDSLRRAIEFMKTNPDCGVLGPKILNPDQSLQPSVRRFPTIWPILLMLSKLPKLWPNLAAINYYLYTDFDYDQVQPVDQVMGAFMLIPRKVFDQIGRLDEWFFIWFEEVDFCRRVCDAGLKVIYNPAVEIIHHGGQSFSQQKLVGKQWRFFVSAVKYFVKHPPQPARGGHGGQISPPNSDV